MALPKDLKKDMAGEVGGEKPELNEAPVVPAPGEEPPVRTPAPAEPEPVHAPVTNPAPKAAPVPDGTVLAKINQRLGNLEVAMAELQDDFDTYSAKTFNYGPIFTKLESVQGDLEKLMTAKPEQEPQKEEPESESQVEELLKKLLEKQENNDRQLVRCLRDNANFQVQVRQQMQHDLDELREQQNGAQFNPILKEISSMYADYQMLLEDEEMAPKTRKNLLALFGQMEDLLADYDAEICTSKVGEERPKHRCRIISSIPTGDKAQHNTIAKSRKPGVMRGRLVLTHEFVDVYVYDPALDQELDEQKADPADEIENQTPVEDVPVEQTPVEQNPVEEAPAEETPVEEAPAEETPVEEAPAEEVPDEEAPAEETPVEETPAEEAPVEENPAEPVRKPSFFDKIRRSK